MRLRITTAVALLSWLALLQAAPAGAVSHDLIAGSGSSWAANAVDQWIADVQPSGLQVVFTASGSATGRQDFANSTNDFAVSDIGYQGADPLTGAIDQSGRPYAYLPIVAGGTSFPYQVRSHGQLVRNIRLSGQTLAKIFTNQITNWNDPQITGDNNGRVLPDLPIIPVVHSEGSGATAQFTQFLAKQYASLWSAFTPNHSDSSTEYFPRAGQQIAQNGADGVINFVTSQAGNGAIGYDEYSYALGKGYPVAALENAAGFFTLPDQYNVAVALTQAQINMDQSDPTKYLLQNLDNVYTDRDPRTYPLSSYSYGIIPTSAGDAKMTTAKRQTLVDYLYHSVCDGQHEMGPIGYSPLPFNLVKASFDQIAKLKAADPNVDLTSRDVSTCNNPTFIAGQPDRNYLAEIAPQPPACAQASQGPCGELTANLQSPPKGGSVPQSSATTGAAKTGTAAGGHITTGPGVTSSGPGATGTAGGGTVTGSASDVTGATASETVALAPTNPSDALASIPSKLTGARLVAIPVILVLLGLAVVEPSLLLRLLWRKPKPKGRR